jgi:hypothetical protein
MAKARNISKRRRGVAAMSKAIEVAAKTRRRRNVQSGVKGESAASAKAAAKSVAKGGIMASRAARQRARIAAQRQWRKA